LLPYIKGEWIMPNMIGCDDCNGQGAIIVSIDNRKTVKCPTCKGKGEYDKIDKMFEEIESYIK
jgi:DnaJ-class molecular chaperone